MSQGLIRNDECYAFRGFIETWESESGFDPFSLIIFFALSVEFADGLDGAFNDSVKNKAANSHPTSNCC